MPRLVLLLIAATLPLGGGCAALTNPVADGIPVRRLPAEVLGRPKADLKPVPPTVLQQREADPYRLDKGDTLAVIADNLIAPDGQIPPVKLPDPVSNIAAIGYPIPVRDDGTISIPRLDPIQVKGLTVAEVEEKVRKLALEKEVAVPANRILVALYQKRQYRVTVIREDSQPVPVTGGNRRGNAFTLSLPAGENDVLRALNQTGGPPGLDARNEVTVLKNLKPGTPFDPALAADPAGRKQLVQNGQVAAVRIPLRLYPEQQLTIKEEDVLLRDGDVVLIEARDTEVYYTSGLVGGGQYPLPRDYDLDIIQAIAQVRGPLLNGGFTQNAFTSNSVGNGIGAPSPSLCTVLRQLPNQKQVPIRVDLNRAFQDPRERILIQPGDIIVLQERTGESFARYFSQTFRLNSTFDLLNGGGVGAILSGTQ